MARRRTHDQRQEQRIVNWICVVLFATAMAAVLVPEVDFYLTVAAVIGGVGALLIGTDLAAFIGSWFRMHAELSAHTVRDPLPQAVRTERVTQALERQRLRAQEERDRAARMVIDGTPATIELPVGRADAERDGDDR